MSYGLLFEIAMTVVAVVISAVEGFLLVHFWFEFESIGDCRLRSEKRGEVVPTGIAPNINEIE